MYDSALFKRKGTGAFKEVREGRLEGKLLNPRWLQDSTGNKEQREKAGVLA